MDNNSGVVSRKRLGDSTCWLKFTPKTLSRWTRDRVGWRALAHDGLLRPELIFVYYIKLDTETFSKRQRPFKGCPAIEHTIKCNHLIDRMVSASVNHELPCSIPSTFTLKDIVWVDVSIRVYSFCENNCVASWLRSISSH